MESRTERIFDSLKRLEAYEDIFGSPERAREVIKENKKLNSSLAKAQDKIKQLELNQVTMLDYNDLLRFSAKTLCGWDASNKIHDSRYEPYHLTERDALVSKILIRFLELCRQEIGKR